MNYNAILWCHKRQCTGKIDSIDRQGFARVQWQNGDWGRYNQDRLQKLIDASGCQSLLANVIKVDFVNKTVIN